MSGGGLALFAGEQHRVVQERLRQIFAGQRCEHAETFFVDKLRRFQRHRRARAYFDRIKGGPCTTGEEGLFSSNGTEDFFNSSGIGTSIPQLLHTARTPSLETSMILERIFVTPFSLFAMTSPHRQVVFTWSPAV
jgi:hypothetical protein